MSNKSLISNVQPHSEEAEIAVLGSMLASKEAVSEVLQWLKPEHFYKDSHAKIFSSMITLFENSEPIDTISVVNILTKNKELEKVGGTFLISGLVDSVPTTAHVEKYSKIILEKSLLRRLIVLASDISKEAYQDNKEIGEILDDVEKSMFEITHNQLKGGFQPIEPILQDAFEKIDKISTQKGSVIGVASGLVDLDNLTSGFQNGNLIIVAGRPGMGKTALALTMMRNAAVEGKKSIGFFSLEMANHELAMRLLCAEGRVDSHLVRTGKLPKSQWKNLSTSVGPLAEAKIFLDDVPSLNALELRAKSRRLKAQHDVDMIIVDYLQLMDGPSGSESRQQEISKISRSMKSLAKELNIPIVALSQLSRAVESRVEKRPQLSDLRESGAIEQDADVVIFLYRPWVYTQEDEDEGKAEIIVAKQRNGPTNNVHVTFIARYARFENSVGENFSSPF